MSKSYGLRVSFEDAVAWVQLLDVPKECEDTKQRVLHRLCYERDQNVPVPYKCRKGRTFDEYTCGNCGRSVDVIDKYCGGCGFAIDWRKLRYGNQPQGYGNRSVDSDRSATSAGMADDEKEVKRES